MIVQAAARWLGRPLRTTLLLGREELPAHDVRHDAPEKRSDMAGAGELAAEADERAEDVGDGGQISVGHAEDDASEAGSRTHAAPL